MIRQSVGAVDVSVRASEAEFKSLKAFSIEDIRNKLKESEQLYTFT